MSKIDTMENHLSRAANQSGGHETREARAATVRQFAGWCRAANRQITAPRNKDFRAYIQSRIEAGIQPGTLQKEASHLRHVAPHLSFTNHELGIPARDRTGHKAPPSESEYQVRAARLHDPGVRAGAELQRSLGLRAMETVRCGESLRDWRRALERDRPIRVIHGTKGGRLRLTEPADHQRALAAVCEAERIARERDGHLIRGKTPGLKSAAKRYENAMSRARFGGDHSPHSLRYAYAQDLARVYRAEGLSQRETRAAIAENLGHGDGRGRYVASVYLRG